MTKIIIKWKGMDILSMQIKIVRNNMTTIIREKLQEYDATYWDFAGYTRKEYEHVLGKYPATMVAPMQYELLKTILDIDKSIKVLLDPFCGSGTSLVEGQKLGLNTVGIDINPYAILLSKVKTTNYDSHILRNAIERIKNRISNNEVIWNKHYFYNIQKWFKDEIIDSLSIIRAAIILEEEETIRSFFWVCFSEVIYKHSNDRTTTFKLHSKTPEDIEKIIDTSFDFFSSTLEKNYLALASKNVDNSLRSVLYQNDSTQILERMNEESIDIICTSPPYGDNGTTVTYGQATILFLKWIDLKDLQCEEELIGTYSKIDNLSLGGGMFEREAKILVTLDTYLNSIQANKRAKVKNFIVDYYIVFEKMYKTLRKGGYMLLTVGNRTVDGVQVPFDKINFEIAQILGLESIDTLNRKILNKTIPSTISKVVNYGAVSSMKEEIVLILKKK